ncbi:MAG: menaquinone biosynthesis protein [Phycisphaerales bacterium]|nr:menaquinone biosynthesis protein [Phycisphaerales bacterium]
MTRVAFVRYLNTLPLVEGLRKVEGLDLVPAAPAEIIGLLESGRADVGLASVIDAARSATPMALLPCGIIGCDGPTLTVRVYSQVPFSEVRRLHADAESHSSVALARMISRERYGRDPEIADWNGFEGAWPEALLLIGDKVMRDPPARGVYGHETDLGEAWREMTGLGFVYACWMCRETDAENPAIRRCAALLDRQRRHNLTRLEWIARTYAGAHGWRPEDALHYLGDLLRFEAGARERAGLARFVEAAAQLGLAARSRVEWAQRAPDVDRAKVTAAK